MTEPTNESQPEETHGTYAAYNRHYLQGVPVCGPCRQAATDYVRQRRLATGKTKRSFREMEDMLYEAWCIIANGWAAPLNWRIDGSLEHLNDHERQWVEAAERWRDRWQAMQSRGAEADR